MSNKTSLAIRSISWRGVGAVLQLILGFIFTLILMRYITPDEYGVVAKVYIVLSLFSVFLDFGFSLGIIQNKEKSIEFLSSHFFLSLFIAIFLAGILCLVSPGISEFYDVPELKNILFVIAINLILGGLVIVHRAYMHKNLKFKELSIITFISFLISGLAAVTLAYLGYGFYSIIVQIVLLSLIQAILLWFNSGFKPIMHFDLKDIKKTSSFSFYIFITQSVNYISEMLDQFLSSIYFSQDVLGKYNRSISLTRTPVKVVPSTFATVLFPLFSHSLNEENVDRNENLYMRSSCIIFHTIAPLLCIIIIFPEEITHLLLPSAWWEISSLIQVLAIVSLFMILELEGSLFLSKGKSKEISRIVFINRLIRIICIIIGIQYGLLSLIYSLVVAEIIMRIVNYISIRYYLKVDLSYYFKKLSIPIISSLLFGIILFVFKSLEILPSYGFILFSLILYTIYLVISYIFKVGQAGKDLSIIVKQFAMRK